MKIYYSNESLSITDLFDEAKWQKTSNKIIMDSYSEKHLNRNQKKTTREICVQFVTENGIE